MANRSVRESPAILAFKCRVNEDVKTDISSVLSYDLSTIQLSALFIHARLSRKRNQLINIMFAEQVCGRECDVSGPGAMAWVAELLGQQGAVIRHCSLIQQPTASGPDAHGRPGCMKMQMNETGCRV